MKKLFLFCLLLCSCTENYSNGERIGVITQFSQTGSFWKSWEGHLNMTQTGMNSSQAWDFSFDNRKDDSPYQQKLITIVDSAFRYGWKVKLHYRQVTFTKNFWGTRGHSDYFIDGVEILDKHFATMFNGTSSGKVIDTIYVVIVPKPQK